MPHASPHSSASAGVHLALACCLLAGVVGPLATAAEPPKPAPWPGDYTAAVAQAQAAHRHLVVLIAAAGCDRGRHLETGVLAEPLIEAGLADFVRVRTATDPATQRQLKAGDEPALAFVNPFTADTVYRTSGFATGERLAREIVRARWTIGMPLTPELEPVSRRLFTVDGQRAPQLLEAGDTAGLVSLLEPAATDDSRPANYLVVKVSLPDGLHPDQVRLLAGTDCLVGVDASSQVADPALVAARPPDLTTTSTEYPLPGTGVLVIESDAHTDQPVSIRITATGCRLIDELVRFEPPAPGTAVQLRHYEIRRLEDAEAATLTGRVLAPAGGPAADAIVRIADCFTAGESGTGADDAPVVTRTDADGRFALARLSPGRFLVRAEAAGGECEQVIDLAAGGQTRHDLKLTAVTTVGIRWAVQTRELVQDLVGTGVQTGAAHVSVANSRLSLASGMRVRTADFGDLMFARAPLGDAALVAADTRPGLAALPAGTPVWHLVDAAYTEDFSPISGLHREDRPFDAIRRVREPEPVPDQDWAIVGDLLPKAIETARERGSFFQFLMGEPVRTGDVFTLRCTTRNCYAKLEITDVTIVPAAPPAVP
jgi:hypothetical protein